MKIQKKTCRCTDKSSNNLNKLLFKYSIKNQFSQIYDELINFQKMLGGGNA